MNIELGANGRTARIQRLFGDFLDITMHLKIVVFTICKAWDDTFTLTSTINYCKPVFITLNFNSLISPHFPERECYPRLQ
jgi:hypothetical protein